MSESFSWEAKYVELKAKEADAVALAKKAQAIYTASESERFRTECDAQAAFAKQDKASKELAVFVNRMKDEAKKLQPDANVEVAKVLDSIAAKQGTPQ